jgi:transposase
MSKIYTEDFKKQIAQLRESGKPLGDITREYGVPAPTVSKWHKQYVTSGTFTAKGNRSTEDNEIRALRKENKRLLMENDILKQAALILARKDG